MFSFYSERPELNSTAEEFFDEQRAEQYLNDGRVNARQRCMAERVYSMLRRQDSFAILSTYSSISTDMFILDLGCGTGVGGEVIESHGHSWLGCDISRAMLQQYKKHEQQKYERLLHPPTSVDQPHYGAIFSLREIDLPPEHGQLTSGDVVQCDIGALLPFRANTFDACVSISSLQWLCYGEPQDAWQRMLNFFGSLLHCLKKDAPCVFQHYPEDNDQIETLQRAACEAGFTKVFSFVTDTSFHPKHFLTLNAHALPAGYSYMCHWEEAPLNVLNTLLLGWKPDYRPAIAVTDLPLTDHQSDALVLPSKSRPGAGRKTTRAHLCSSDGAMQVEQQPTMDFSATSVFCFDDIVEHIFYSMVASTVDWLIHHSEVPSSTRSPRNFMAKSDNFESPLAWGTLRSLSGVSKGVRAACARLNFHAVRTKVYQRLHDDWRLDPTTPPSFYYLRLEREEMTHYFIGSFLTGENPLLPLHPNNSSLPHCNNSPLAGTTLLTGHSTWDDPRASTGFWRTAMVETCELFYLDQFLMWLQLFKYLPASEHGILAPPAVVWHIWTVYALSPHSAAAYHSLCMRYLGRPLAISDCATIDEIDLNQEYRTYSPKYRYRASVTVFSHPNEYDLRMRTYDHVCNLNGYADHFTWDPDACDPSCFGGKARVLLASGELCELRHVRVGDHVLSASSRRARRVVAIRVSTRGRKAMVRLNGFWITRGHPIWLPGGLARARAGVELSDSMDVDCASQFDSRSAPVLNTCLGSESAWPAGEWVRPDEILPVQWMEIAEVHGIYNLILAGEHDALIYPEATCIDLDADASVAVDSLETNQDVSPTICCTLGRYCGVRLARLHPRQNGRYGPRLVVGVEKNTA